MTVSVAMIFLSFYLYLIGNQCNVSRNDRRAIYRWEFLATFDILSSFLLPRHTIVIARETLNLRLLDVNEQLLLVLQQASDSLACREEWNGGDHLRKFIKFINIFIWNWFFSEISYRNSKTEI